MRRVWGRARRALARLRRVTVRQAGPDTVRVSAWPSRHPRRSYRLDDPQARHPVRAGSLRLALPDPAALSRLAASGLLTGQVRRLRLRLATAPQWLLDGVRPAPLGRTCRAFTWRRHGSGLLVELAWVRPREVARAYADVLAAVLRARPWDQTSGPVYGLDRAAWLEGGSSWPQGRLVGAAPEPELDSFGRPLGPFLPAEKATTAPAAPAMPVVPVVTAVANPYGRRLVGAAAQYRLDPGIEAALLRGELSKYSVITVDSPVLAGAPLTGTLQSLAACGIVFAAPDPVVRASLDLLGLVTVAEADEVTDLAGYALSVTAARRAAIDGDPALRRTILAGDGAVPLPGVSVVLASMRSEHIGSCLDYLAGQDYPALEVLVGLHGYEVTPQAQERWQDLLPCPLRVRTFPAEVPFGAVLGRLSRLADGELITKVDDDDHYGRHHITDLVVAWHTSGADLVAKGARFVHLPERGETIDRTWTAPEVFDVTPAGGTMLLSRGALARVGGWSHSSKHVDADLLDRVKSAGGVVYRTHAMEYVYVRRTSGHTFDTGTERLLAEGERTYPGLPDKIIRPD